jgi:hypothetical protein
MFNCFFQCGIRGKYFTTAFLCDKVNIFVLAISHVSYMQMCM